MDKENKNQQNDSQNNKTNKTNKDLNPFGQPKKNSKKNFNFYWIYGVIILGFILLQYFGSEQTTVKPIQEGQLNQMLKNSDVQKIVVINKDEYAEVYIKPDKISKYPDLKKKKNNFSIDNSAPFYRFNGDVTNLTDRIQKTQELANIPEQDRVYISTDTRTDYLGQILGWVIPILLFVGFWIFMMRRMGGGSGGPGGQIFNIGKSKAQLFDKESSVTITFNDVAGLEEAKVEIMEIVDFLKNPKKYTDLGGKIPKGALLVGPPGTGKTLLAKAVAGEAKVPFFSLSGSDFVEMFVGVGASRVRDLFKQAKEKSPCIIFIDEIDAIGRARGKNQFTGGNDERENTLNQLLTEMDGFGGNQGVIILAATNRADILDRALLRAGRFDRQIHVELPELPEREAIFKVHSKNLKMDQDISLAILAKQTPGFSGADIANVCNEAALIAARRNSTQIEKQDFSDAIDRIIGGLEKRSKIITPHEKSVIAHHEAGHATVSWLLENASPLVKVTIIPRGKALGAAWYLPEERQLSNAEQMLDEMAATLGGRAAEEIIFNKVSTGALNDLERVTKQAYAMVTYFGLNKTIGNLSYYDSSGQSEYSFSKPYSEKTAETIDVEVRTLVEESYQRALKILSDNLDKLKQLAAILLEKEVIFTEDVEVIFGKRPWKTQEEIIAEALMQKNGKMKQIEEAEILPEVEKTSENSEEKKDESAG